MRLVRWGLELVGVGVHPVGGARPYPPTSIHFMCAEGTRAFSGGGEGSA
jgi:hypothetical protein